jgi:hypothetical protein
MLNVARRIELTGVEFRFFKIISPQFCELKHRLCGILNFRAISSTFVLPDENRDVLIET